MNALARVFFPVEPAPPAPVPGHGRAVELAARAHAAASVGDRVAGARVVGEMLADDWWGPVLEAAVLRRLADARVG